MDVVEIDELINVINHCGFNEFSLDCHICPFNKYEDCSNVLQTRINEALKRLRYLETPTDKEQPEFLFPDSAEEYFSKLRNRWVNAEKHHITTPWYINWPIFDIFEKYAKSGNWGNFSKSIYTRTINVLTRNKIRSVEQLIALKLGESEELRGSGFIISDLIDSVQQYAKENS